MEPDKGEESGEMYLPDKQGEYTPKIGTQSFSVQGLPHALMALDTVMEVQPPVEEFALQLEVKMADCPEHPRPPAFSWNAGMVLHGLKSNPMSRDLKHIQVDGPGMAYLSFFNKQGHRGLTLEAAQAMRAHVGEAFAEWISQSAHSAVNPIPLAEGWYLAVMASDWHRHQLQVEYQGQPVPNLTSSESDSTPPLVGNAPPSGPSWTSRGHWDRMGC